SYQKPGIKWSRYQCYFCFRLQTELILCGVRQKRGHAQTNAYTPPHTHTNTHPPPPPPPEPPPAHTHTHTTTPAPCLRTRQHATGVIQPKKPDVILISLTLWWISPTLLIITIRNRLIAW